MIKVLSAIAFGIAAMVIANGCVTQNTKTTEDEIVAGERCGNKICTGKTFCCNESCSICAPIGGGCTQQVCLADDTGDTAADELVSTPDVEDVEAVADAESLDDATTASRQCGPATCHGLERCCSPTCGTCVGPFEVCIPRICEPGP